MIQKTKKPTHYGSKLNYDVDEWGHTAEEIIIEDKSGWSGLYDSRGYPLYKQKEPFGFVNK